MPIGLISIQIKKKVKDNIMGHKVFISFKTEDFEYKRIIQEELKIDMIDKSLNEPINSDDPDYIMYQIRKNYLYDSTVTIALIGKKSAENLHPRLEDQYYIKKEIQASLYSSQSTFKSGLLAVILPDMYESVYPTPNTTTSQFDGSTVNVTSINDNTVIKEISANYYLESPLHESERDYWRDDERYVVAVKWSDFEKNPDKYIDKAFDKRSEKVSEYTKVRPK